MESTKFHATTVCNKKYIEQTRESFVKEHLAHTNSGKTYSIYAKHTINHNHTYSNRSSTNIQEEYSIKTIET